MLNVQIFFQYSSDSLLLALSLSLSLSSPSLSLSPQPFPSQTPPYPQTPIPTPPTNPNETATGGPNWNLCIRYPLFLAGQMLYGLYARSYKALNLIPFTYIIFKKTPTTLYATVRWLVEHRTSESGKQEDSDQLLVTGTELD